MNQSNLRPPLLESKIQIKQMLLFFGIGLVCFLVLFFFAPVKQIYLIVFGIALLVAGFYVIKNLLDKSPTLVINQQGVADKRLAVGVILWSDIKRVYRMKIDNTEYVCMELEDENKYRGKNAAVIKGLGKLNQSMTELSPFSINTLLLDTDADSIYETIIKGCEFYQPQTAAKQS